MIIRPFCNIEILKVNDAAFAEAWEIFRRPKMSFTDCTIAAAVKIFQIDVLATFDRGFKKFEWINILD
ncbi:type II toxin-antitoxin system VapC family toxin [Geoglobus ahangari]